MLSTPDREASEARARATAHAEPAIARMQNDPRRLRRFVWSLLAAAGGTLLAVLALNIAIDPYDLFHTGLVPTAIENDRAAKIGLLYRLKTSPDILILGSSRSRHAQPAFLQQLTGRTGFNAGVTGGDATDEWVFTRMLYQRFPDQEHHVLMFISGGVGSDGANPQLAQDARARPFLPAGAPSGDWSLRHKLQTYLSYDTTRVSLRVVRACVINSCTTRGFHPDGSLLEGPPVSRHAATSRLRAMLRSELASVANRRVSAAAVEGAPAHHGKVFVRLLGFLNAHGVTPVIVMVPFQPKLMRALQAAGDHHREQTAAYLAQLHRRFHFVYIDLSDVRTFGGSPLGFIDPTHVTTATMRLMLRYIVQHDQGVL